MDDRLDLSPLDPRSDPVHFDRVVGAMVRDAMQARRVAARAGVLTGVVAWSRPALVAAGLVAILAGTVLLTATPVQASGPGTLVEEIGIPRPVAEWASRNRTPSVAELMAAFPGPEDRASGTP